MRSGLLALALLFSVGCAGTRNLIAEGEQQLAAGKAREAAATFKQALQQAGISGLDRTRAAVGEARAFLAQKDLVGAETRLRRIEDSVAAKHYFLGQVELARSQPQQARAHLERALEMTYGKDTGELLAKLIAAEARSPKTFAEAAAVARRGARPALADALAGASEVWRKADAGHKASALLAQLAEHKELPPLPATQVLRARLLEGSGKAKEAAALWTLADAQPAPSDEFRAYAQQLRARLASERGDLGSLEASLEAADPATAARIRGQVAALRLERGDLEGALEAAQIGGGDAALAGRYLELLGRPNEAAQARAKVDPARDAVSGFLLAPWVALRGDPLGALAALPSAEVEAAPHLLGAATRAHELRQGAHLLESALRAEAQGWEALPGLDAARLLLPGDHLADGLRPSGAKPAPPRGRSARALASARAEGALRRGDLVRALECAAQAEPAVVRTWLAEGLRRGLRRGQLEQAKGLVKKLRPRLPREVLLELRACAELSPLHALVGGKQGVAALAREKAGPWGSLRQPKRGLRVPRVRAQGSRWRTSGGSDHPWQDLAADAEFSGGSELEESAAAAPFAEPPRPARSTSPVEVR